MCCELVTLFVRGLPENIYAGCWMMAFSLDLNVVSMCCRMMNRLSTDLWWKRRGWYHRGSFVCCPRTHNTITI